MIERAPVVCVESNVAINLFMREDGDREAFNALRLMKTIHGGFFILVITELALAQMLPKRAAPAFERFKRLAEFSRTIGVGWFRIGAPLPEIFKMELAFPDPDGPRMVNAYPDDFHQEIMSHADGPLADFEAWHQHMMNELAGYIGRIEHARDLEARRRALESPDLALRSRTAREEFLRSTVDSIPNEMAINPFLKAIVEDPGRRARVVAEPHRCPTVVSLSLMLLLNMLGSAADPHDIDDYRDLMIQPDSWTDARVMAESASADVFVTNDKNLQARAHRVKAWGCYKPRIISWQDWILERTGRPY